MLSRPHRSALDFGPVHYPNAAFPAQKRRYVIKDLVRTGFPYSRKLIGHTSCVNALAFSSGDGRWLASAGDDPYILLWDFHQDNLNSPSWKFDGPRANVFTLAFSATNEYLYSGDTNSTILRYDITSSSSVQVGTHSPTGPSTIFQQHMDNIRAISCHPEKDEIFLSGGEDGCIIMHDSRAESQLTRAQGTLRHDAEFTGVQYHPTMPHIFATSDNRGQVCLRDTRMAFGPLSQRSQSGIVQTYVTTLSKPSLPYLSNPEVSSIAFDSHGTKLAVTMLHYFPTIYSIPDIHPIAICSGRKLPDGSSIPVGERTYSNSCTIKHGSFGNMGLGEDQYYSGGSDDFRAYVWEIPDNSQLLQHRERIEVNDWAKIENPDIVAFASARLQPRYIPVELSTPLCRLSGHQSIINTTLFHPCYPLAVTSGIERHIVLHSPTATSSYVANMSSTSGEVRALPMHDPASHSLMIRALTLGTTSEDLEDDVGTIALFDEILRQEGEGDVFLLRRWNPDSDEDMMSSDDDEDASEDWV